MAFENETQAAEALLSAVESDRAETGDAPSRREAAPAVENTPTPPAGEPQEQPLAPAAQDAPPTEDSFTGIDPDAIPEELKPLARSLQGDYTRKMQAIAEEHKQYEAIDQFGGVSAAAEAIQFVTALATDPEYALQVHEQLTEALVEAGMTPAQASRAAATQIADVVTETPAPADDDYGLGIDPATEQRLAAYEARAQASERELQDLRTWREREEETRLQAAMMAEMESAHADVVQKYSFDDEQMSRVYPIAYSTGGDLRAAAEIYSALADSIVSEYITKKAAITAPPNFESTGGGEQPVKFTDLYDPQLEKLVQQRLRNEEAQGNL